MKTNTRFHRFWYVSSRSLANAPVCSGGECSRTVLRYNLEVFLLQINYYSVSYCSSTTDLQLGVVNAANTFTKSVAFVDAQTFSAECKKKKTTFLLQIENMPKRLDGNPPDIYGPVQYMMCFIRSFPPYVSVAAVIRGWHCSVPFGPLHPVIFPSSSCALNGEGGSVTSLPRTTTVEGGTRFTQPHSSVCRVHRPPQASPAPSRRPKVHMKGSLSEPRVLHSLLLTVT